MRTTLDTMRQMSFMSVVGLPGICFLLGKLFQRKRRKEGRTRRTLLGRLELDVVASVS